MGILRNDRSCPQVLAFCHIPKTAGLSVVALLRQYFGRQHVDAIARDGITYSAKDLSRDWALHRGFRSIAGHSVKPHQAGALQENGLGLQWYTLLRDPVGRYLSHFQHEVEKGDKEPDLLRWMERYRRENFQVRTLAGSADLDRALEILDDQRVYVGLSERLDESLIMLAARYGLESLPVASVGRVNPAASSSLREAIRAQAADHHELVLDANRLDIELYRYARDVLFRRSIEEFGGSVALEGALERCRTLPRSVSAAGRRRALANRLQRNLVYKPFVSIDRRLRHR